MREIILKSHLIRWLFSIIGIPMGEKQLLRELKFIIGEQYDNYEFNLEDKGSKTINKLTYEMYLYQKDNFKELFDLPISRGILLLFNADVLASVYYRFKGNHFEYLLKAINSYLPRSQKMIIDPFVKYRATTILSNDIKLVLLVKEDGNTGLCLKENKYY